MALQSVHVTLFSAVATDSLCVWSQDRWKRELFRSAFCSETPLGITAAEHRAAGAAETVGLREPVLPSRPCPLPTWLLAVRNHPPLPAPCQAGQEAGRENRSWKSEGQVLRTSDLCADKRWFAHRFPELSPGIENWADLVTGVCCLCSWPRETPAE